MNIISASTSPRPEIVVDFDVEDGLLTVSLKNVGGSSAYLVRTSFDKPFHGLGGEKCISTMRVFREVSFMPPGKEFIQLVDSIGAYFRRREPSRITATISYEDREGHKFKDVISHDLRIYRDLGFTSKPLRSE